MCIASSIGIRIRWNYAIIYSRLNDPLAQRLKNNANNNENINYLGNG